MNIIKGYEASVEVSELTAEAYEHSEMLLYKASLLEEGGDPAAALEQLTTSKVGLSSSRNPYDQQQFCALPRIS